MENTTNVPAVVKAALAEQNIPAECNLMLPTQTFGEVLGMFDKVTIEVVTVNSDPEAGEVFALDGKSGNKLALGKIPLQKIANALSIMWDPKTTTILESTNTKSRAKATGAMRKPNGEYVVVSEEKTVDLGAIEEEQRIKIEEDAEKGKIVGWKKTQQGKSYPEFGPWTDEAEKRAFVELSIRKAVLTYRKFKDERAMTGAKERVIRAFLAIKGAYSKEELSHPFAFPRVTLDAAKMLASPETRAAAVERLTGSVVSIFGPGGNGRDIEDIKALPAPEAAPAPRTVNEQSGEILQAQPAEEGQAPLEFADIPFEAPEETARRKLAGFLALERKDGRLTTSEGWKSAAALIRAVLDKPDTSLAAMNELIARVEKWLAKNGVRVGDAS